MLVARLDDIVQRIVRTMFARGLMDNSQPREEAHKINMAAHAKISRADAEEGMVLLKNQRALLPLAPGVKTVGGWEALNAWADGTSWR